MIRVGLFSQDCTLQPLLSSALGTEFQFFFESKEEGINRLLSDKNCHVMILDLNSNHDSLKERIACARRMVNSDVPWVIMADDGLRVTANELVRQGAYTGTVGSREGYLEQSKDVTLFLDEIGELSLFTQVKLLRVLQQREFSRLVSNRLIPLRSRLIFATHRNLADMVAQGKFRQDLYYRINVMKIEIPSLQERMDDIGPIANHFMRHYGRVFQKPMEGIDPEAMMMLENYHWPGNVRELENVIQRAIILARG